MHIGLFSIITVSVAVVAISGQPAQAFGPREAPFRMADARKMVTDVLSGAAGAVPSYADLVVESAHLSPEPGVPGEAMELSAVVINRGQAAAGPSHLRACEDVDTGFCTGDAVVPALAAGQRAVVRASLSAAATMGRAAERPRSFIVRVDVTGSVRESLENNNATPSSPAFIVEPKRGLAPVINEEDERAVFRDGVTISASKFFYGPDGAPSFPRSGPRTKPERGPEAMRTEVHPKVQEQAAAAGANGRIEVIVHAGSRDASFPRLPDLDPAEPRLSPANGRILAQRAATFEAVRRERRQALAPLINSVTQMGGRVSDFYVLGSAFRATIPVNSLDALATDSRIRNIEPVKGGETPPNHDEVEEAIDIIGSDAFFNVGATGAGWDIALLDTGVRPTHSVFSLPDRIGLFRDCVFGNSDCVDTGNVNYDPSDNCAHGTSSAGILVGNSNSGASYRGVTAAVVDSFVVYDNCFLDTGAVLNGFDRAVFWADKVIVANMQSSQSHTGSIADAADNAFDSGSLVIAANGNNGPGAGTVNSPANAHKAIGVGAFDLVSGTAYSSQSRGPTGDDRIKPDVRFPNNSETAGSASDTDTTVFTGTSGATPYGGGTGMVLVDQSQNIGWSTDPGRIYSMLIAFGDQQDPFGNISGAGDVSVGLSGDKWVRGTRSITNNDVDTVSFDIDSNDTCIEAAIWWPEGVTWHNDIDLYLDNPNGVQQGSSIEVDSVFERIRVNGPFAVTGTWNLRIEGYSVKAAASPETVYYFAHVCD